MTRPRTLQSAGNRRAGALSRQILALGPWFHNLHLDDRVQTAPDHPLGDFPRLLWERLAPALPADLRGWRALDVGCNAGFYSFELARRGCRVVGIDDDPHYLNQARWAARRLGLSRRVELRRQQVYEVVRAGERYDLILFMGVFYHLRHPLLALDGLAAMAERLLVFQSLTLLEDQVAVPPDDLPFARRDQLSGPGWPRMSFVERRLAGDPTNVWVPSPSCVEALLRDVGLQVQAHPARELWVCRRRAELPARIAAELSAAAGVSPRARHRARA